MSSSPNLPEYDGLLELAWSLQVDLLYTVGTGTRPLLAAFQAIVYVTTLGTAGSTTPSTAELLTMGKHRNTEVWLLRLHTYGKLILTYDLEE